MLRLCTVACFSQRSAKLGAAEVLASSGMVDEARRDGLKADLRDGTSKALADEFFPSAWPENKGKQSKRFMSRHGRQVVRSLALSRRSDRDSTVEDRDSTRAQEL